MAGVLWSYDNNERDKMNASIKWYKKNRKHMVKVEMNPTEIWNWSRTVRCFELESTNSTVFRIQNKAKHHQYVGQRNLGEGTKKFRKGKRDLTANQFIVSTLNQTRLLFVQSSSCKQKTRCSWHSYLTRDYCRSSRLLQTMKRKMLFNLVQEANHFLLFPKTSSSRSI